MNILNGPYNMVHFGSILYGPFFVRVQCCRAHLFFHINTRTKNKNSFRNPKSNSKILQNTNFWKIWPTWPIFLKLLSSTIWMKDTSDSWFTLTPVSSVSLSIHTSGSLSTITMLLVSTVARERMKCLHIFSPSQIMLTLTCWEIDTINLCWLLVSLWTVSVRIALFVFSNM